MVYNKHQAVWFNKDQQNLFEQIKKEGMTSRQFSDFVKEAFHDKIDNINIKKITQKQIQDLTKKSIVESPTIKSSV